MRKSKIQTAILACMVFPLLSLGQIADLFIPKMTAINPVSYTDVVYTGVKDTVVVCTYNGRLAERVNGRSKERFIANLRDEIYALAFNKEKNQIAASTFQSGIIIVNRSSGKILYRLPLKETWALRIEYSKDMNCLFANDQRGNRFIWDVSNNYRPISFTGSSPQGALLSINRDTITSLTPSKILKWNLRTGKMISEKAVSLSKFGDTDAAENILNIRFNECELISSDSNRIVFSVKHPSWLRPVESMGGEDAARTAGLKVENGYFEDPHYQMALTQAKFAQKIILTASIDRSIRVWDKQTGSLLKSLTGHKATVNKIKVNKSETQIVSVDLQGGIRFWDVTEIEK